MNDEWGTPDKLFRVLNKEFLFTVDVASSDHNAKLPKHFTKENNGLAQSWTGERVFCNPPYSKDQIGKWVAKAFSERSNADTIVMILPVRTDRAYFHDMILGYAEIRFIRGRPNFIPCIGQKMSSRPPFNSMVVIYRKDQTLKIEGQSSLIDFSYKEDPAPLDVYLKIGSLIGEEVNDDEVTILFEGEISIDGNCWRESIILTDSFTGSLLT